MAKQRSSHKQSGKNKRSAAKSAATSAPTTTTTAAAKKAEPPSRISTAMKQYRHFVASHPHADRDFRLAIEDLLKDSGVTFDALTARIKRADSFRKKLDKKLPDGNFIFPGGFPDAYDLIGIRITTYHSTEIPDLKRVLEQAFQVERIVDKTNETRVAGGFGYGSVHLICRVKDDCTALNDELRDYSGQLCEIQLRTVLQHAWAEFEHDIRYKSAAGANDPRIDRAFTLAAGLIELADQQFDQIANIVTAQAGLQSSGTSSTDTAELTADLLPGVLTMILGPDYPRSNTDYYPHAANMLKAHGIDTIGQLRELLSDTTLSRVRRALHPVFPPGQVRVIDDALLLTYGKEHIRKTVDIGAVRTRSGRLGSRWKQLLDGGWVS